MVNSLLGLGSQKLFDLVDEFPARWRRRVAVEPVHDVFDVGSGRESFFDSGQVRLACARRAPGTADRRGVLPPGARAGRAPPAATGSPRRTGELVPTGPRTGCPPHRVRAARWSACRWAPCSRDAKARPPARANGWWRWRAQEARAVRHSAGMPASVTASTTPSRPRGVRRSPPRPRATATTVPDRARARRPDRSRPDTNWISGQSMTRSPPSAKCAVGRVCCRSRRSVRSSVANGSSSSSCSSNTVTAPSPATPASTQPDSATTISGRSSVGQWSTVSTATG